MSTTTTRAAVQIAPKTMTVQELELPEIPADAGILRVLRAGICGADVPMYADDKILPRILGKAFYGKRKRTPMAVRPPGGKQAVARRIEQAVSGCSTRYVLTGARCVSIELGSVQNQEFDSIAENVNAAVRALAEKLPKKEQSIASLVLRTQESRQ